MENNTLESQLLSESCRALAILNVQTADPATDSFRVRDLHPIPLFSEQACVSDCSGRAFATKAIVCNFYQCAVVSAAQLSPYGSASAQSFPFRLKPGKRCRRSVHQFAARIGTRTIRKRCIRSFHCFLRKQGQLHLQSVSAIQPSLTLAFIVNLCI